MTHARTYMPTFTANDYALANIKVLRMSIGDCLNINILCNDIIKMGES